MSLHMWCSSCQQDVPAVATPDDAKVRCARCKEEILPRSADECQPAKRMVLSMKQAPAEPLLRTDSAHSTSTTETPAAAVPSWAFVERPPVNFEAWRWDQDLFDAERLLQTYRRPAAERTTLESELQTDLHPSSVEPVAVEEVRVRPMSIVAWALISLGVMAAVFGGVLLGWSVWSGDQRLWSIGLPVALGGQAGLVLGLVFQLDVFWQGQGHAASPRREAGTRRHEAGRRRHEPTRRRPRREVGV